MSWLGEENIALAVLSSSSSLTLQNIATVQSGFNESTRKNLLWNRTSKLEDFFTVESKSAPCLNDGDIDFSFWQVTMSSNRSCERYIGKVKNISEKKQVRDDEFVEKRVKAVVNLQDKIEHQDS